MEHQPIVIVGAGLGGLTAARVLHHHGIRAAVYDRDVSPTGRPQHGVLDLHPDSGQAALRAAGLDAELRAISHPGDGTLRILDREATLRHETVLSGWGSDGVNRPEIDRRDLRNLLLGALPAGTVRYGAEVTGARPLGGGRHEVRFAGRAPVTTDVLIGADGGWSRIRPLVSAAVPTYTGLCYVGLTLFDADARHPAAAAVVGGGLMFALGGGRGLIGHRDPDGSLHVYAVVTAPPGWAPAEPRGALLDRFTGWHPALRSAIGDAGGPLTVRPIDELRSRALPAGHRWPRTPGVTLLGDAAHLMPPFAGDGANRAMLDGAELAAALVGHAGDPEAALAAYEELLFPRGAAAAAESAAHLAVCFREDAPQGLIDLLTSYHELVTVGE